ncbi:MAG: hypothetical protein WCP57_10850 [Bacteroidota bacterium]
MKISASLYSDKNRSIEDLVHELDSYQIDAFHIDCNDDVSVFEDIHKINAISQTIIDLHIITETPDIYIPYLQQHPIEWVTFQYENLPKGYVFPTIAGSEMGLAIMNNTPIEVFDAYANQCSFILLMTTTPGQSGGSFNTDTFKKIRNFKNKYPDKRIHVDGGVNAEVSFILRDLGVYSSVSGSYLLKHAHIGAALYSLKAAETSSSFLIKDFMIPLEELPVLDIRACSFESIVRTMDQYKLGFTLFTDKDESLAGVTSNADLRKGILKNMQDLQAIKARDIINLHPIKTNENNSIHQMLQQIKQLPFVILFMPVVDEQNRLKGAVTFNNLIKGES